MSCPTVDDAAGAAIGLERAILDGAAEEREELATGVAFRSPALPDAYVLNQVVADPVAVRALGADALIADVEIAFGAFGHRRVWVPDEELGAEVEAAFVRAGFQALHDVVLAYDGRPPAAAGDADTHGPAVVADRRRIRSVEAEVLRREGHRLRVVTQLLVLRDALNAAAEVEHYVAEDACHATTYACDGVAKVEDLATLPRARGRGLARAVVELATARALAAGHEHVLMVADADDWQRDFYGRVGYRPVGGWWSFTRIAA